VFIIDGGVHIPKLESAKITYAGYFAPVADTSSPLIKMRLRCKCCTTAPGINFHNVTARGDASSFSNAAEHLLTCPSNPPLTVEDSLKRADKKKQPMVLAAAQEGARLIMDGEDHLKQLGMSKEMLWEGIVEMLVADAEPLGAVGRFGMRRLFTQLKLPLMGVTTSHRIFEKMTKELIKVPIEEQLRVWSLTPMGYNAGARPHFHEGARSGVGHGSGGCGFRRRRGARGAEARPRRGRRRRVRHLRNRLARASLTLPIVTFHLHRRGGGGGAKSDSLAKKGGVENQKVTVLFYCK
jgi:hypothetical protein